MTKPSFGLRISGGGPYFSGERQNILPSGWEIARLLRRGPVAKTAQAFRSRRPRRSLKALYDFSPDDAVTMDTDRFHLKEAFVQDINSNAIDAFPTQVSTVLRCPDHLAELAYFVPSPLHPHLYKRG